MEMTMHINETIIEVTRKCNMSCDHCLRGCAQSIDIDHKHIDALFDNCEYIGSLALTGGEPSLNIAALEYVLESAQRHDVGIGNFYIATNGSEISIEFVVFCLKLYAYCDEKNVCTVQVSNDNYHMAEGTYDTELLDGLGFFSRRETEEARRINLIDQGRAAEFELGGRENIDYAFTVEDDDDTPRVDEGEVYLNAKGYIVSGCDWSYENQEEHIVCHVDNLTFEALKNYEYIIH